MPLPSDYVNYVKLTYVDSAGFDRTILPERRSTAKQAILQDEEYNYMYDNTGEIAVAGKSETTERFQSRLEPNPEVASNFYSDDIYDQYYSGYFGRQYGSDPEHDNINGTFQMDLARGIIYFNNKFQAGDIIGFRYISDGLCDNDDLDNVYVPKMAEDALYAFILYNLTKIRTTTAQLAPMYQKEMRAKMRNAKIRLSNYKIEEIAQVMRGRAKWIKH